MQLTDNQRRYLRGLAHALKPVVMIGDAGLTEGVCREAERALHDHELIKIRARVGDRAKRNEVLEELARRTGSALVQQIDNVGVFYRRRSDLPKIVIPDA